jgi:predicted nuclease of predicted toxin-antitoxin system
MKFKLDENFGPTALEVFHHRGLDCRTVREEGLAGAADREVLAAAAAEERVLVTLDRDFANVLRFPPEQTAGVVVVHLRGRASRRLLAAALESFLSACEGGLLRGKLWIVEPNRIREHRSDDHGGFGGTPTAEL